MNEPANGKPTGETPAGSQLPVVWSPKLDAGEGGAEELSGSGAARAASSSADETTKAAAGNSAAGSGAPSSSPQPSRFMLLAASVAIAAAVGALFGSLSASGFAYFMSSSPAKVHVSDAKTLQAVQAIKAELAELSSLKASWITQPRARTASSPSLPTGSITSSARKPSRRPRFRTSPTRSIGWRSAAQRLLLHRRRQARSHRARRSHPWRRRPAKPRRPSACCRTGSCRTSAAIARWSPAVTAVCSLSQRAGFFPASAALRRSNAKTAGGSSSPGAV